MAGNVAYLVFDIETISDGHLVKRIQYHDDDFTAEQALEAYRVQLLESSDGKSDFIPHTYALPVSVAIAKVDAEFRLIEVKTLDRPKFRPQVITRHFWEGWKRYGQPRLVTFNGRGFDVPVLEMAAFRYGIETADWFKLTGPSYQQPRYRYSYDYHIDLLELMSNFGSVRMHGGLNLLATLLGKPGKLDTKGSMVQDLYNQGEHIRIDDYCVCDALDTYFVFLRTRVLTGELPLELEHERVVEARNWIEQNIGTYPVLADYLAHFHMWSKPGDDDSPFIPSSSDEV